MTYQPLHHKYRPQTFAALVGQEAIATTLTHALQQQKIAPAYLFTGARGTGKTSSARILAKSLNCLQSPVPTETPCGVCEVCRAIANGSALDVIEIDAASNTGVDNIRELIERAQFAPVQCRYKVYVIDECLTGDTLVQTQQGMMRIDDPQLRGQQVLSYDTEARVWEYKRVLRWLDQGDRQTFIIQTAQAKIRCTGNHLIRTETGWIPAAQLQAGMKILSPSPRQNPLSWKSWRNWKSSSPSASAVAERVSTNGYTLTSPWGQMPLESGLQTSDPMLLPQWSTSLETIESVRLAGVEPVYDIEVEDNHNFVANGLLVHNCHMLSTAAFNALLKTLEEPPDRVVFVLATTDPQRVLPTIISRCQRFDYRRIPLDAMVQHLGTIADKEAIAIAPAAITLISQLSQGGLRDAESLLDQLSLLAGEVTVERVWDLVGAVPERDLMALVAAIAAGDPEALLDTSRRLMDRGREPMIVLQNLASFYRDLLIAKTAPQRSDLVAITPPTWAQMVEFARNLEISQILAGQQHLRSSEVQLKHTTQPRLWLEVTLMGLLPGAIPYGTALNAPPTPSPSPSPLPVKPTQAIPRPTAPVQAAPLPVVEPPAAPPAAPAIAAIEPEPAPEPAPIAPPPISVPDPVEAPAASPAASRLGNAWVAMLRQLQPTSTQMLMRQQGCLLELTDTEAVIGINAQWHSNARTKLENLEAAFEKSLGQKVSVRLQVITPGEMKAAIEQNTGAPPPIEPPASDYNSAPFPAAPIRVSEAKPPEFSPQNRQPPPPADPEPPVAPNPSSEPVLEPVLEAWEQDATAKAARQLADFFGGRVVDLSNPEVKVEAAIDPAKLPPPPVPEVLSDPDDDDDDLSNVPF